MTTIPTSSSPRLELLLRLWTRVTAMYIWTELLCLLLDFEGQDEERKKILWFQWLIRIDFPLFCFVNNTKRRWLNKCIMSNKMPKLNGNDFVLKGWEKGEESLTPVLFVLKAEIKIHLDWDISVETNEWRVTFKRLFKFIFIKE